MLPLQFVSDVLATSRRRNRTRSWPCCTGRRRAQLIYVFHCDQLIATWIECASAQSGGKRRLHTQHNSLVKSVDRLVLRLRDYEPRVVHHAGGRLLGAQDTPRHRDVNLVLSAPPDTLAKSTVCRQSPFCNRQDLSLNLRTKFRHGCNYRVGVDWRKLLEVKMSRMAKIREPSRTKMQV